MNAISPPSDPARRILRLWLHLILLLVSVFAGSIVWSRPIPPTWIYAAHLETIDVIGITRDGRIVSIDSLLSGEESIPRLRVREVETGRVIADHSIPDPYRRGKLSGDGNWVLLDGQNFGGGVLVVSLKDWKPRYPYLPASQVDDASADGRFAVMYFDEWHIVDLTTGQILWQCEPETLFSSDSQQYITVRWEGDNRFVSIRSLSDNHEVLSDLIPDIPDWRYEYIQSWTGERLFARYRAKVAGVSAPDRRYWSFDTRGEKLSDPRRDPLAHGRFIDSRTYAYAMTQPVSQRSGELRLHFPPTKGSLLARVYKTLSDWNFPLGESKTENSWQPFIPQTIHPVGVRLRELGNHFKVSSDGHWLVDGGDQLRVWRIPATRSWTRWLQTFLAATLPWSLRLIRFRRRLSVAS